MRNLFFLLIFFIIISCSPNKKVYWCGDHPCINKKEREAYFKKTMIVEVKDSKNKSYGNDSEIEKIIQEAQLSEKTRIKDEKGLIKQAKLEKKNSAKQVKLEEKKRIKEEKKLAKQVKLEEKRRIKEEKRRIKEEKKLAKQIKLEEKLRIKDEKKQLKKNVESDSSIARTEIKLDKFSELVEKITKKNSLRAYPDINDMPN